MKHLVFSLLVILALAVAGGDSHWADAPRHDSPFHNGDGRQEAAAKGSAQGGRAAMYHDGWIDLNKNGRKDVYEDPTARRRAADRRPPRADDARGEDLPARDALRLQSRAQGRTADAGVEETRSGRTASATSTSTATVCAAPGRTVRSRRPAMPKSVNAVQRFFVEETRLGVPADFTNEGIRGLCHWGATSLSRPDRGRLHVGSGAGARDRAGDRQGSPGARLHQRLRAYPGPRPRSALGPGRRDLRRGADRAAPGPPSPLRTALTGEVAVSAILLATGQHSRAF